MTSSTFFKKTPSILTDADKALLTEAKAEFEKQIKNMEPRVKFFEEINAIQDADKEEHFEGDDVTLALTKSWIFCTRIRIGLLEKIQAEEPITLSQQKFLLVIPALKDSFIARYPLIEEKPESKMQLSSR